MVYNQSRDTTDLVCAKAAIGHERHRLQPELGHVPLTLHVDVRRFPAVGTEENETIRSITKYGRHRAAFLARMFLHSQKRFYAEKADKMVVENVGVNKDSLTGRDAQWHAASPHKAKKGSSAITLAVSGSM